MTSNSLSTENQRVILTPEGAEELRNKLDYLKQTKRKEVAGRIHDAAGFGDLSENSEYEEAKKEQAEVEAKIFEIENKLSNCVIIDEQKIDTSKVHLGNKVKIKRIEDNKEMEFVIVGSTEADPSNFKISNESPLGKALIGRCTGERIVCAAPIGKIEYEIINIS